jgi:hypothetical protein
MRIDHFCGKLGSIIVRVKRRPQSPSRNYENKEHGRHG